MKLTCCLDTSFAHKTNSSSSPNVCKRVYISSRCYRFLSQRLDNISIKRRWQNFIFTVTREGETNKKQTLFTTTGTRHCWGRQRDTPQCHTRRILGSDKLYSFYKETKILKQQHFNEQVHDKKGTMLYIKVTEEQKLISMIPCTKA